MPRLEHIKRPDEDWTGLKDAKERRKLQNRLNVRAHRRRKAEAEAEKSSDAEPGPFGLLKTHPDSALPMVSIKGRFSMSESDGIKLQHLVESWDTSFTSRAESASLESSAHFPLCPDHLIPLAQYNIIRATLTNATILSILHLMPYDQCAPLRMAMPLFPSTSTTESSQVGTLAASCPPSLRPTALQLSIPHDYWVDLVPDPTLRDNILLALQDGLIDVVELQADLVGQICQETITAAKAQPRKGFEQSASQSRKQNATRSLSDEGQLGMLVWSDPWCADGYEMAEAFIRRWSFLFKGCWRFLGATNKWRISRGEEPLELDI
ncbi:abhydrolase domain-containing [Fusarium albosuccineum]|uniref:Abhydrolase domain-containing n=1 Tax=Fusarium albosuccineum TaxID=1237068 RepID=A0A8H4P632_9HYPO|nr:abhydrolase domain-containing [Fusarium albosuccineum]